MSTVADIAPTAELTTDEARRLTERIRTALDRVSTAWADLAERVAEAYQRRADKALGYDSWADYARTEFSQATASLAAEVRRELVGMLSAQGMSTRAIAPAVGLGKSQVSDIRSQVSGDRTPDPAESIDPATGEVLAPHSTATAVGGEATAVAAPPKVVGIDGKTYTTERKEIKPRRTPLADQLSTAEWELNKAVERIQRLVSDDRFPANKEQVAPHLRSHLKNTIQTCQDLLDRINN